MHQQMAYLPYTSLTCGNCISHNSTDDSDQLEPTLNRATVLQETSDYPTMENPKKRALDICVLTSGVTSLRYSKYTFTAILRVIAENKNTRLLLVRIADPAVMSPMFIYRIARNMGKHRWLTDKQASPLPKQSAEQGLNLNEFTLIFEKRTYHTHSILNSFARAAILFWTRTRMACKAPPWTFSMPACPSLRGKVVNTVLFPACG